MREPRSNTRKVSPNDGRKGSMSRLLEELEKDYDQEETNAKKKGSGPAVGRPIIVSPSNVDRAVRRVMNTRNGAGNNKNNQVQSQELYVDQEEIEDTSVHKTNVVSRVIKKRTPVRSSKKSRVDNSDEPEESQEPSQQLELDSQPIAMRSYKNANVNNSDEHEESQEPSQQLDLGRQPLATGICRMEVVCHNVAQPSVDSPSNSENNPSDKIVNRFANTEIGVGVISSNISVSDRTGETLSMAENQEKELKVYIDELFKVKKFISSGQELESNGRIARFFYRQFPQIDESFRENWWAGTCHTVRKAIDVKRATVSMAIKTEVISKFIFVLSKNQMAIYHSQYLMRYFFTP